MNLAMEIVFSNQSLVPREQRAQHAGGDGAPRRFAGGDAEEREARRPLRRVFFPGQRDDARAGGAA